MLILAIMDRCHSFREGKHVVLVVEGENDATACTARLNMKRVKFNGRGMTECQ
jgi:hypothetical protein